MFFVFTSMLGLTERESYVVIILLHSDDPRDVIKGDGAQTKVRVVGDVADLLDERVQVGRLHPIDSGDKICGRKTVMVGR
jgi:hypothetical protein